MTSSSDLARQQPYYIILLAVINGIATAALVFAWPILAPKLAAPFGWAFGKAISTQLSIWELPFMLLWVIPLTAAVAGWILDAFEETGWAALIMSLPLVTMVATLTLFRLFG